jgi:alkaline phosphatase D
VLAVLAHAHARGFALTDAPLIGAVTDTKAKVFIRADGAYTNIQVQWCTDSTFAGCVGNVSPPYSTSISSGRSDQTALIAVSGLTPNTKYFHRILQNSIVQTTPPYPSFWTFPSPTLNATELRFAVVADLNTVSDAPALPAEPYASIASIPASTGPLPSFVLQIGDMDHRDPNGLTQMRSMYRDVRGGTRQAGVDFARYIAPRFPVQHVWDNHDYTGDNRPDRTSSQRKSAIQAFKEYWPMPDSLTPQYPNPMDGIWHMLTYGNMDVILLDLRAQRDPKNELPEARRSMLGDSPINGATQQKQWLKDRLRENPTRWKIVVSSVSFNRTVKTGASNAPYASWGRYNTERQEIVDYIMNPANGIKNVLVISGDMHSGGSIDDGTNTGSAMYAKGPPEASVPHTNIAHVTNPNFYDSGICNEAPYCPGCPCPPACRTWDQSGTWNTIPGVNNYLSGDPAGYSPEASCPPTAQSYPGGGAGYVLVREDAAKMLTVEIWAADDYPGKIGGGVPRMSYQMAYRN